MSLLCMKLHLIVHVPHGITHTSIVGQRKNQHPCSPAWYLFTVQYSSDDHESTWMRRCGLMSQVQLQLVGDHVLCDDWQGLGGACI